MKMMDRATLYKCNGGVVYSSCRPSQVLNISPTSGRRLEKRRTSALLFRESLNIQYSGLQLESLGVGLT